MGEERTLRDRQRTADAAIDRLPARNAAGADAMLVQTFKEGTYPTVAGAFYACHPCQINGVAAEGNAASYVADPATTLYCWNSGSAVPPQGTVRIADAVGGVMVFNYDG